MTLTTQTHGTVPVANSAFIETLGAFLRDEDAARYRDMFAGFVAAGGLHGPGAGLTHTPSPMVAYCGGYLVTETGSITYADASTSWVAAHAETTGSFGAWVRVAGTHYLVAVGAQPALPPDATNLMEVTTAGGAVTAVRDMRQRGAVQRLSQNGLVFSGYYADLQEAVDALPPEGGTVFVEPGIYTLTETLRIGNGSAAAASTRYGVNLRGWAGGGTDQVTLQWAGGADPVISVLGPLAGWAIENLTIQGADTATDGIQVIAGQYGRLNSVTIYGCQAAAVRYTSIVTMVADPDFCSRHNHAANLFINAAGDAGIALDGAASIVPTQYNTFDNTLIVVAGNGVGIYLGVCANNHFTNLHISDTGGATACVQLAYDNGVTDIAPAGNMFTHFEPGPAPWIQTGTPGDGIPPNLVVGLSPSSLPVTPPDVDGVAFIYTERTTGDIHILPSRNPTNGTDPVGNVVVGQTIGNVSNLIPAITEVASLGAQAARWLYCFASAGLVEGLGTESANVTLGIAAHTVKADATVAAFTVTLPTAIGVRGKHYIIKRINAGANAVTVATTAAQTIDGAATYSLTAQWKYVHVVSDDANWLIVGAN